MKKGKIHRYSSALQAALNAVRTTNHLGYGLAPLHPTQAMAKAGALAGGVSFDVAARIYTTMLAAQDDAALHEATVALFGAQENIPH